LPETSAGVGSNVHILPNKFHIWQESLYGCPLTNALEGDGRRDGDITSKRECDVIDLTNEDSSNNDEEL